MLVNTLYRPTEPFYSLKCFLPYLPHPYKRDANEKHDNDLKNFIAQDVIHSEKSRDVIAFGSGRNILDHLCIPIFYRPGNMRPSTEVIILL